MHDRTETETETETETKTETETETEAMPIDPPLDFLSFLQRRLHADRATVLTALGECLATYRPEERRPIEGIDSPVRWGTEEERGSSTRLALDVPAPAWEREAG